MYLYMYILFIIYSYFSFVINEFIFSFKLSKDKGLPNCLLKYEFKISL